ncbi:hypothetical protein NMD69_17270 (plasmid) [Edwardsiella tarda]|uniref:hypothetical protein n=1 Tax=Edwardsiella tarda TaxID=636 RepID=UPI00266FB8D1|nr:hypothetical protein [Edwardsiella tarda]WKS82960.1 hypothetical protein NHU85_17240 [Edwardsiella tarda]
MCAQNRSKTVPGSQLKSHRFVSDMIKMSQYPICVRGQNGHFIAQNSHFNNEILNYSTSATQWLSSLPTNLTLSLMKKEIEMFSNLKGMYFFSDVLLDGRSWDICFQPLCYENNVFSIWHFYESSFFVENISFPFYGMEKLVCKFRDEKGPISWNIFRLRMAGLSHRAIANLLSISIGSSKNHMADAHKYFNTSSNDDLIIASCASGLYITIAEYAAKIIKDHVTKTLIK